MQLAQYTTRHMDGPVMSAHHHGDSLLGALMGLIFLIVIAGLTVYVVRTLTQHRTSQVETREPIDIAKERYAKGEITKEELAEIKHELK